MYLENMNFKLHLTILTGRTGYNESSKQDYTASWNSETMRFRPHENATSMKIRISIDIVPTSTEGSLFVDSTVLSN